MNMKTVALVVIGVADVDFNVVCACPNREAAEKIAERIRDEHEGWREQGHYLPSGVEDARVMEVVIMDAPDDLLKAVKEADSRHFT